MSAGGVPHPAASAHVFVGDWGPAVPHQYLAVCLWFSGRRYNGNIPMTGHAVLPEGGHLNSIVIIAVSVFAPLAATWAHVVGVESDVTIPTPPCLSVHA